MNRLRTSVIKLSVLAITTCVSLVALELYLRRLPPNAIKPPHWAAVQINYPECLMLDKDVIYRPIPSLINREGCAPTDKLGFRMPTVYEKNVPNIVFLGDSFTFGLGVSSHETYPYYIQQKFNEENLPAQVYNAGVIGYGVDQDLILLEKRILPHIQPDIVVLNVNENDFVDNNQACLFTINNNGLKQRSAVFNSIYFVGQLHTRIPQFIKPLNAYLLFLSAFPERWAIGCSKTDSDSSEGWQKKYQKMRLLIQRATQLSDLYKFKLIITYIQSQFAYDPTGLSDASYNGWTMDAIKSITISGATPLIVSKEILQKSKSLNLADSHNANILGTGDIDLSHDLFLEEDPLDFGNKHMNAKGNLQTAEVVYPIIKNALTTKERN